MAKILLSKIVKGGMGCLLKKFQASQKRINVTIKTIILSD